MLRWGSTSARYSFSVMYNVQGDKPHHVAFADALDRWNLLYLSETNAKAGQWSVCDHWLLLTSEAESVSVGNLVHFILFKGVCHQESDQTFTPILKLPDLLSSSKNIRGPKTF